MAKINLKDLKKLLNEGGSEIATSFISDLEKCICLENKSGQREISKTYKPSSMNCKRLMYFQVIGTPVPVTYPDPNLVGILETGSTRHDILQSYLTKMKGHKIKCEYLDVGTYVKKMKLKNLEVGEKRGMETKLRNTELNLSFMTDGIIKYNGEYYILEIKTETIYKHNTRKDVAEEHYNQAIAYSVCFGIDKVLFLYECRDNLNKKAFLFEVTEKMKELFIKRIEDVDKHVKKLMPPPKGDSAKACTYCNYVKECAKYE